MMQQGSCRCKMAGTKIQSFAKFHAQMCAAECQGLKTVARFVAFYRKFKSRTVRSVAFRSQILPRSWHSAVYWRVVVGIPQYVWARKAKGLRRSRGLWHSAEIGAQNAKNDWIPVPAILHRQFLSLLRHKCLPRDFPDKDLYAANCLGLNYTRMASVNTPSRDTIPLRASYCTVVRCWQIRLRDTKSNQFRGISLLSETKFMSCTLGPWPVTVFIHFHNLLN
jgi:hypothetical protein